MDWQEIFRDSWQTSLVFVSLLAFTRVLGKTQVGQLTYYEYISGITIGSIAASIAASEPDKVWSHYYDLILFVILTYLLSVVTIKNRPLRKIIEGAPTLVIENGRILKENMRSMRYDLDELNGQLRQNGVLDIAEVQYAFVETTGDLSVIKKSANQTVTKSDMGLSSPDPVLPAELIMDGEIIEPSLRQAKLSKDWLMKELTARGISDLSQVTYAVIDSKGNFFISEQTNNSQTSQNR